MVITVPDLFVAYLPPVLDVGGYRAVGVTRGSLASSVSTSPLWQRDQH